VIDIDVKTMDRQQMETYAKDPKNRYIVAVPVLLILSFIFYVIAGFFSYLGGGESSSETAI
jgi:zona occludens toxin (predicted ATPase)